MAINFPSNPNIGDTFTANDTVFTWNGSSWSLTQQTYNTTSQNYGSNTQNIDIDIANGNNARISLDTNIGSQLRINNIPTNKSSKLSILMERSESIGELDIDTAAYKGSVNLYSEFLIDDIIQIFLSPDGTRIFLLDSDRLQSGSLSTPWDLNTVDKVASVSAINGCNSLYISNDGLNAYITNNSQNVYHVILSNAWDITSGNFVTPDESFDTSIQGTGLQSVFFRYDETSDSGKTMYVLANDDTVYQYTLSTAWSFSATVSYVFQSVTITADTIPTQIYIKPDGTSLFVYGATNDSVFEYNLLSDWNIGGSGNGVDNTFDFSTVSSGSGNTFFFNPNGSEMYLSDTVTNKIHKYNMTGASIWDISAAQYDSFYDMYYYDTSTSAVFVSQDGTKMYVGGYSRDYIYYYILETPWDITTARYQNKEFYVGDTESTITSMYFSSNGKYFYILGLSSDTVRMYLMDTPWDISTARYVDYAIISAQESSPYGLWFRPDGLAFYVIGTANEVVYQYNLDSPWTLGNRNYTNDLDVQSTNLSAYGTTIRGLVFTDDGNHMFIYDDDTGIITQFKLNTPWQVNGLSNVKQLDVLGTIGDNGYDMTISPDGEHLYIVNLSSRKVFQYDIDYGEWDLQNYSGDGISFNPADKSGDGDIKAFRWGKDGYRLYVLGRNNPTILQYNCDTQYDISSISAATPSGFLNVGIQEPTATGFMFSNDGSILYVIGTTVGDIHQYILNTPWEFGDDFAGSQYDSSITPPDPSDYHGEAIYTTPGTYNWICPANVTSVSVVCIGGGGGGYSGDGYFSRSGGGGGLGWKNNIPVTPGQTYTAVVGEGGLTGGLAGQSMTGGTSYFINSSTVAGIGGNSYIAGSFVGDGGGNGGNGVNTTSSSYSSGGGGAGGYTGNGGAGAYYTNSPTAGTGGAGGGGGGGVENGAGARGGGVGIFGIGASGSAGSYNANAGGDGSVNASNSPIASSAFGYGGRSTDLNTSFSTTAAGGNGAVRIVWGRGRTYPYEAYLSDQNVSASSYMKIQFKPDGTKMYVMGTYDDTIVEYILNTPWDLTSIDNSQTAVFQTNLSFEKNLRSFFINPDGTKLFFQGSDTDNIFQYSLETPWDITTISYDNVLISVDAFTIDIGFNYSGSKLYILEDDVNTVNPYTIATYSPTILWPDNITWENGNPPEIPALGTSTLVELYVSNNGETIYGLEKIKNSDIPE